mmetsp:Transcript_13245/g.31350  ORF Transcript_13245/g.31350 Transcript_13245/m.31350 type:complete len:202 (-) Transcript_13245:1036-1641(-)
MASFCSWVSCLGMSISKVTRRSPNSDEKPCTGMPSPLRRIVCPGLVVPVRSTNTSWPSRCSTVFSRPRRASFKEIFMAIFKSFPSRVNTLCLFVFSFIITSPGTWPGDCSDFRGNLISAPSATPFSITADRVVSSTLHFCFEATRSSCCTIIPGPIWRCTMRTSSGHRPQLAHLGLPAPFSPAQPRHTIRRLMFIEISLPL